MDFLWLGAIHIWEGVDHLLFIFGLLLVAPNLKMLIKVLTGFTIAHSITLILSALQIVSVPGKFVDPLVAVSIIFVGVENIVSKKHDKRFWIAAGFGLIHGFAFAGNLRAAGLPEGNALFWSLLSFNVGVELAQLSVCLAAWPILKYLEKSLEKGAKRGGIAYPAIVKFASGGIAAMGLWLFIKLFVAAE
jgi:hydrogenase/urease accessory protein HupE